MTQFSAYESLLEDIRNQLRISNWLMAEAKVNLRPHPTADHDALVRERLYLAAQKAAPKSAF